MADKKTFDVYFTEHYELHHNFTIKADSEAEAELIAVDLLQKVQLTKEEFYQQLEPNDSWDDDANIEQLNGELADLYDMTELPADIQAKVDSGEYKRQANPYGQEGA